MEPSLIRLLKATIVACLFVPAVCILASQFRIANALTAAFVAQLAASVLFGAIASFVALRWLSRDEAKLRELSLHQAEAVDRLAARRPALAIATAAAASLLLELVLIRWQGSVFKFFDIYKNLGLLACFVGLGVGYSTARREGLPLAFTPPLILLQIALMLGLKYVLGWRAEVFLANPVREQLQMGLPLAEGVAQHAAIYVFMAAIFLLTSLTFLPIGRLCGRTMLQRETLAAYAFNLLGSIVGVALTFVLAALWTPPAVWFALSLALLLLFHAAHGRSHVVNALVAVSAVALLSVNVPIGVEKVYSPYQLIERGPSQAESMEGLSTLTVSGKYYQRILDLSKARQSISPPAVKMAHHYELPYRLWSAPQLDRVAVLGAGTGNDVAAALRAGAADVDAVEIDPVILRMGRIYHPEQPYSDARVDPIVDDARTFLRRTDRRYDLIVYGLLDAQTLLAAGTSVRLDSFVYTVEALKEARARLTDRGRICLSFAVCSEGQGRKMYKMIEQAFDGRGPVAVRTDIGDVTFLIGAHDDVDLKDVDFKALGFQNATAEFADPRLEADVSTDDWPFLYMQHRVYPISYLAMLIVVPLASWLLIRATRRPGDDRRDRRERARFGNAAFLLLGAGFMLIETKGITELGLTFGNTWQVIGVVILGVLGMAFLANLAVRALRPRGVWTPYLLLIASLGFGLYIAVGGGFSSTFTGRVASVLVLTAPLFFSGLVFSTLLSRTDDLNGALASNLFGAVLGGLLEYNAMYFGYRFLYLLGIAVYALALVSTWIDARRAPAAAAGPAAA